MLFYSLIFFALFLFTSNAKAATYISLDDNIYEVLEYLEVEGIIKSGLLSTRPLSRKELLRLLDEAEGNAQDKPELQILIKELKKKFKLPAKGTIKPFEHLYSKYIYTDTDIEAFYYNMDGDIYGKGSNLRVGSSSLAELGVLSFYINPELRYSKEEVDLVNKRLYSVFSHLGLDLTIGKDSQWWGPGYHGALLISNNAAPMTILRLTNPHPTLLPSIFRYLGLFKFTFFVTRLERKRIDVSKPYLWGMRLNFKPTPSLEIGLQRTALLGGENRPEDLKTWWYSFTAKGENLPGVEAGDQKAGFDIKLTLPFKAQPLKLYIEVAGEDEAGGLPSKWAYLWGLYLPWMLYLEKFALRIEYARTKDVWYRHHIYTAGYTYKGRIIGHHMGTDSSDFFTELSYHIPRKDTKISIFYDREVHNLSRVIREKRDEANLRFDIKLPTGIQIRTSYSYGRIKNIGGLYGLTEKINTLLGMIRYNF